MVQIESAISFYLARNMVVAASNRLLLMVPEGQWHAAGAASHALQACHMMTNGESTAQHRCKRHTWLQQ